MIGDSYGEAFKLLKRVEELKHIPQTPEKEAEATRLQFEAYAMQARLDARMWTRAEILFDAIMKSGKAVAQHDKSSERREDSPYITGNAVQNIWNARGTAESLARWSVS